MPDWTYYPLRAPMRVLFGEPRSLRMALAFLSRLVRVPGGSAIVSGLGRTRPPALAGRQVSAAHLATPVGASVGPASAADAVRALPPLGAGLVEIGPVPCARLRELQPILESKRAPIALRVAGEDAEAVVSALGRHADFIVVDIDTVSGHVLEAIQRSADGRVLIGARPADVDRVPAIAGVLLREGSAAAVRSMKNGRAVVLVTTSNSSIERAADLVASGADTVLATQEALIESGPGWFIRATVCILNRLGRVDSDVPPANRVAWLTGAGLGLGMIFGGLGAAVVALGPVLLPYDAQFLKLDASSLDRLNPQLIHFLQHDRITLAGTMVALGILYGGLSWSGIRQGRVWARDAMLASGVVGFPTLFYFFAYHYVEPVHVLLAVVLFPLFLLAVWKRPWNRLDPTDGDDEPDERHAALVGQFLMSLVGVGLIVGGATISYLGLTTVFVPSDLTYMSTSAAALAAANDRLLGFVAHDRAGFGGALASTGVVVLLISAWGWHRGESWVWWCMAAAALAGFGAAIAIHVWVGYTDFLHLAPVYTGTLVSAVALGLSRRHLLARRA